ncbi:hypothetical protein NT6N_05110 [Oceaniferula spumae]|uniref:Uncharacterized protein n=1 Tax=Oceaniferula spumae TaxID=2979115 RepID=A0AAT9FHM2_9BACT
MDTYSLILDASPFLSTQKVKPKDGDRFLLSHRPSNSLDPPELKYRNA